MTEPEVLYRVENNVAWITLNRPKKGNSISQGMGNDIIRYLIEADAEPTIIAIVLAGSGDYWCTGADLSASNQAKVGEKIKEGTGGNDISKIFWQIKNCKKPTIARVHGPVMGGGLGFLFACDIRVAIASTFFAFSEAKRGIVPALISAVIVPQMGPFFARDFMMTARRVTAQRYYELDVVQTVEELDNKVKFYLSEFESSAPEATKEVKRLVNFVSSHSEEENIAETAKVFQRTFQAEEALYGVGQFLQKKKPDWQKFHADKRAKL